MVRRQYEPGPLVKRFENIEIPDDLVTKEFITPEIIEKSNGFFDRVKATFKLSERAMAVVFNERVVVYPSVKAYDIPLLYRHSLWVSDAEENDIQEIADFSRTTNRDGLQHIQFATHPLLPDTIRTIVAAKNADEALAKVEHLTF